MTCESSAMEVMEVTTREASETGIANRRSFDPNGSEAMWRSGGGRIRRDLTRQAPKSAGMRLPGEDKRSVAGASISQRPLSVYRSLPRVGLLESVALSRW